MKRISSTLVACALTAVGLFGGAGIATAASPLNTGPGPDIICYASGTHYECKNWGSAPGHYTVGYTCPSYTLVQHFILPRGASDYKDYADGRQVIACSSSILKAYARAGDS